MSNENLELDAIGDDITLAVKELFYWQYNRAEDTNFSSLLYNLFQKADQQNLAKLTRGFPHEAIAWNLWRSAPNEDVFFLGWGFKRSDK